MTFRNAQPVATWPSLCDIYKPYKVMPTHVTWLIDTVEGIVTFTIILLVLTITTLVVMVYIARRKRILCFRKKLRYHKLVSLIYLLKCAFSQPFSLLILLQCNKEIFDWPLFQNKSKSCVGSFQQRRRILTCLQQQKHNYKYDHTVYQNTDSSSYSTSQFTFFLRTWLNVDNNLNIFSLFHQTIVFY